VGEERRHKAAAALLGYASTFAFAIPVAKTLRPSLQT
jgi:hypothetical protein